MTRICLAVGRKLIDHAVHSRRRRGRVQRTEDEVAGFGRLDRDRHCFEVAHLADQHDVGILAQRRPQCRLEAGGVRVHFALVDDAALVLVHELDRILDRDDVIVACLVDVISEYRPLPARTIYIEQTGAVRFHTMAPGDGYWMLVAGSA
jgi:hypothetical protein